MLFATQRYDRRFDSSSTTVSGLPRPYRLHQEDFAQAMGIPAAAKYEQTSSGYMRGMFDILRKYSAEPVTDQLKLWDIIVFDYLIGNTDAHIKNFSLLYDKDLRQIRLAPAYDIVSTVIYEQSIRDMSFRISGTMALDDMSRDSFSANGWRCAGLTQWPSVSARHYMNPQLILLGMAITRPQSWRIEF